MNTQFQDSPRPKPSGIEWGMLCIVFFVEMLLDFLWSIFLVDTIVGAIHRLLPNLGMFWGDGVVLLVWALAKGSVAGFIAANRAGRRKYLHAALAGIAAALTPIVWAFLVSAVGLSWHEESWTWRHLMKFAAWSVAVVVTALYGAYMAQSFERNRGVRIG